MKSLHKELFIAAGRGFHNKIKCLIAQGAEINYRNENGTSVLMQAIKYNRVKVVRYLLSLDADITFVDKFGDNAVVIAFGCSDPCLGLLLDYLPVHEYKVQQFFEAIECDNVELVKQYLSSGYNPDMVGLFSRHPALFHAVHNENIELIELLVKSGADLNYISPSEHFTPLLLALITKASLAVIKRLIELGADISLETELGFKPLSYTCAYLSLPYVKLLVELGADVNETNEVLKTPLMFALSSNVGKGSEKIEFLIECGADATLVDEDQCTSLMHLASEPQNIQAFETIQRWIQILINNGVEVDATNDKDETALIIAAMNNNIKVLNALIALKADVNRRNLFDETALMLVGTDSQKQELNHVIIKILINNAADVSAVGPAGLTPIQYHAFEFDSKKHDLEIFKLLIGAGADIHYKNENNESFVDIVNASKDAQLKSYFKSIQLKDYLNDNLHDELIAGDIEQANNRPML